MHRAVRRFLDACEHLGLEITPQHYPAGTRTAQDAADAIGCQLDQIVKSLVFVAETAEGDRPVLALTAGGNRVDTAALAATVGADRIRKATADEAREATGFAIGGTPPFGHTGELVTVIDPRLLEFDEVHAAAGTPDTNFGLSPEVLRQVSGGLVVDVTEG